MSIKAEDALYRHWPVCSRPCYAKDAETIAHHEASHAVLMVLFGIPVAGAEAAQSSGKVGIVRDPDDGAPLPGGLVYELEAIRIAAMYVGGIIGELIHHGVDVQPWFVVEIGESYHDWTMARRVLDLGGVTGSTTGPLYLAQRLARDLLNAGWPAVETLADELMCHGRLSGEETESIIRDALGERLPELRDCLAWAPFAGWLAELRASNQIGVRRHSGTHILGAEGATDNR